MTLSRRMLTGATCLAATAVIAAVGGCSSSSSSSSSSVPAPSTTATSSAPTSAAATSPSSSAAGTPGGVAGGPPACPTRYLKATAGVGQGAAGSVYQVIDFTNISNASCTLFGYPGVALAGGSPVTQIGAAASRSTQTAATLVTLGAGETANALLRITQAANYPTSKCTPVASTYLQIYPPNQTTPIYLAYKSTGCSSTAVILLSVSVVQPGSGG
jgi:Protein of unknown function (DUF4232)